MTMKLSVGPESSGAVTSKAFVPLAAARPALPAGEQGSARPESLQDLEQTKFLVPTVLGESVPCLVSLRQTKHHVI